MRETRFSLNTTKLLPSRVETKIFRFRIFTKIFTEIYFRLSLKYSYENKRITNIFAKIHKFSIKRSYLIVMQSGNYYMLFFLIFLSIQTVTARAKL
jgi:hypothetical protein